MSQNKKDIISHSYINIINLNRLNRYNLLSTIINYFYSFLFLRDGEDPVPIGGADDDLF